MLTCFEWNTLTETQKSTLLQRPILASSATIEKTQAIINAVRQQGDSALLQFTREWDGATLSDLAVSTVDKAQALDVVSAKFKAALSQAYANILKFHQAQLPTDFTVETLPGVYCSSQAKPIARVGLYIPGGTAPLPSTVLMLGIPAQVAKCTLRVLCSPPDRDGKIDPHILYAAQLCGISTIYKVGGAQAIAAMAYGTTTIPKVDKIYGPGNSWVTLAKYLVAGDPHGAAYDSPAGPSEVLVIADDKANPQWVAADLLSQAEHGIDSQVILICLSTAFAKQVQQSLAQQLEKLSRREIARQALIHSRCFIVEHWQQAINISNDYAPEHLILQIEEAENVIAHIEHAGSVFVGAYSPESAGDYASGTNHVLPTYGYARAYGGLSLKDFMKSMSIQRLTAQGLQALSPTLMTLAETEGLDAHANAVRIRQETF